MELGPSWRRGIEAGAWLVVATAGGVMLTQAFGWDGFRLLAPVQALTPYLLPLVVVTAAVGLWLNRPAISASSSLVGLGVLLLATPIVFPPGQPEPRPDAVGVRAASVNLLYTNPDTAAIADDLLDRDIDVIVFSEYTAEHQTVLDAHALADRYPHRVDRDGLLAGGIAVWSRFPIEEGERAPTVNYSIDSIVDGPDGEIRVLAVHPPTPIYDFAGWKSDMDLIGDLADQPGPPTLVIGDFNASYWHPVFRELLRRGLVDAHMANDRGWSTSWPTDVIVPPFVRLDHALTGNGLVSIDVDDFRVPGSDHEGLVVTVVPAR